MSEATTRSPSTSTPQTAEQRRPGQSSFSGSSSGRGRKRARKRGSRGLETSAATTPCAVPREERRLPLQLRVVHAVREVEPGHGGEPSGAVPAADHGVGELEGAELHGIAGPAPVQRRDAAARLVGLDQESARAEPRGVRVVCRAGPADVARSRRVAHVEHDGAEIPVGEVGPAAVADDRVHEVPLEPPVRVVEGDEPECRPGAPAAAQHGCPRLGDLVDAEVRVAWVRRSRRRGSRRR